MKHFVRVGILTTILTVLIGSGLDNLGLMPVLASVQGAAIDALFRKHIWVISFLFSLIIGFMLYSFVVFRRKPGEEGDGDHFEGHTSLEIAWTIVPLGIVMYFSFLGASALAETRRADPNAYNITIVGSQWSWRFDYTDYDFSSTELRLPIDRQSLLTLTSTDVIHSFWVPEFRLKQDALPGEGMERELRITPTLLGDYKLRCAELCGLEHAYMVSDVIVMEVDDFEEWVMQQHAVKNGLNNLDVSLVTPLMAPNVLGLPGLVSTKAKRLWWMVQRSRLMMIISLNLFLIRKQPLLKAMTLSSCRLLARA